MRGDLGAYVVGVLEPAEAAAVREHLMTCVHCAAEHARLVDLPELLKLADGLDAAAVAPPAAVEERLLDLVARERAGAPRRRRSRRPWAFAAAAAAVALAALAIAFATAGDRQAGGYDVRLEPVGASTASAHAQLEAVPGGTAVHLWVRDLPHDPTAVYEVRCEAPGWSASAGTFRVDTGGRAYVVLTTAARRGEYDAIQIVRRDGGDAVPVLAADLS